MKKFFKKLGITICIIMAISLSMSVLASDTGIPEETQSSNTESNQEYTINSDTTILDKELTSSEIYEVDADVVLAATDFMKSVGKSGELIEPIDLYNLNDHLECICYKISTGGWITVNAKSHMIDDYCDSGLSEPHQFLQRRNARPRFYTNGPLQTYYDGGNDKVIEIHTGEVFNKNDFIRIYDEKERAYEKIVSTRAVEPDFGKDTKAWNAGTTYFCVPTGSGIFLEYYQRKLLSNSSSTTIPDSLIGRVTQSNLMSWLTSGKPPYLVNAPLYFDKICNGSTGSSIDDNFKGLNTYLDESCYNTGTFYQKSYDWNHMKERLDIKKPLLIHMDKPTTEMWWNVADGSHTCVACGYHIISSTEKQFIINDGWGNNHRYVGIRAGVFTKYIFLA